jgi:hypothetical protein
LLHLGSRPRLDRIALGFGAGLDMSSLSWLRLVRICSSVIDARARRAASWTSLYRRSSYDTTFSTAATGSVTWNWVKMLTGWRPYPPSGSPDP